MKLKKGIELFQFFNESLKKKNRKPQAKQRNKNV